MKDAFYIVMGGPASLQMATLYRNSSAIWRFIVVGAAAVLVNLPSL